MKRKNLLNELIRLNDYDMPVTVFYDHGLVKVYHSVQKLIDELRRDGAPFDLYYLDGWLQRDLFGNEDHLYVVVSIIDEVK